jgi:hypothetical protein
LGILWYGDGNGFGPYKDYNHAVKPQVSGGRVYAIAGGTLVAYDAYTGRLLWRKEFTAFRRHARFATLDDGIYLIADGQCLVCDPATGKTLKSFTFNAAGATTAKDLRVGDDVRTRIVAVTINERSPRESKIGLTMRQPGLGKLAWLEEDRTGGPKPVKRAAGGKKGKAKNEGA